MLVGLYILICVNKLPRLRVVQNSNSLIMQLLLRKTDKQYISSQNKKVTHHQYRHASQYYKTEIVLIRSCQLVINFVLLYCFF